MRITIARAELNSEVSGRLIAELNAELTGIYPEPGATHFQLDPSQVIGSRGVFLIASAEGLPVGCGALRLLDNTTAELKRMYVVPAMRGKGIGRQLVTALESEARSRGVQRLVLETGIRQDAALALYRSCGFRPIPLFGEYCLSPDTSVCLGKELDRGATELKG
jgi:GNAT superfamily N-acetyltransferase